MVAITALPTYKVKAIGSGHTKGSKDGSDPNSKSVGEGGVVAAGTEKERQVSPEDAHHPPPNSRNASI